MSSCAHHVTCICIISFCAHDVICHLLGSSEAVTYFLNVACPYRIYQALSMAARDILDNHTKLSKTVCDILGNHTKLSMLSVINQAITPNCPWLSVIYQGNLLVAASHCILNGSVDTIFKSSSSLMWILKTGMQELRNRVIGPSQNMTNVCVYGRQHGRE